MAKAKILIVEDEAIVAKAIQLSLKSYGYDAAGIASAGLEAIQKTAEMKPDLVLMDIVLKGDMDGIAAAKQIHDRFDIPVVYLTAYTDSETIERAKITEPFGYITKPFDEKQLHTNIEMALYKHKMDKALRQSAQQWQTTFDGIMDAVCLLDNDAKILQCNQSMGKFFSGIPEEFVGQNCCQIVHGSPIPLDGCPFVRMRSSLKREQMELSVGEKWFQVTVDPLLDDDGKLTGAVHVVSDITERKQAEEELENIFNLSPDMICVCTPEGGFLKVSPSCQRVLGYTQEEILKMGWAKLVHPDDVESTNKEVARQLKGGPVANFVNRYKHKDGSYRILEWQATPSVNGIVYAAARDITERKRVEEKLADERNLLRALVDNLPDRIFVKYINSAFVFANIGCARHLGAESPQAVIGKTAFDFLQPEAAEQYRAQELEIMRTGKGIINQEVCYKDDSGRVQWHLSTKVPWRDEDGNIIGIIGLNRDITEHKRAEEALRESEERFRTSVENMLDCFGIYTAIRDESGGIVDFRIEYVNKAACVNNHMAKEEQIGKRLLELLPAHRETGLFDMYCQVVERDKPLVEESLIYEDVYKKKHLIRAFDIRVVKLGDGFAAAWRDITERKEAEALARFPLENPNPVLRISKEGTIQYANPAGGELLRELGCEVGSGAPKHWNRYIRRALKSGSNEDLEVSCGDGIYSLIIAPVADAEYVNLYGIRIARGDGAEEDMRQYHRHLEDLVQIRTAELSKANEQLLAAIEGRRRLEKEILSVSEREQRRIGEELHDSLGQQLTGIAFMTKVLERKLARKSLKQAADVGKIARLVEQATEQARNLVKGLGPVDLSPEGLVSSLEELARKKSDLFGIRCVFGCDNFYGMDDAAVAVHIYRIVQEAVINAVKHGKAKNVEMVLACGEDECVLTVKSDGQDFPKEFEAEGAGMGLKIMEHRVDIIGGVLDIRAADEGGTILTCTFPGGKERG